MGCHISGTCQKEQVVGPKCQYGPNGQKQRRKEKNTERKNEAERSVDRKTWKAPGGDKRESEQQRESKERHQRRETWQQTEVTGIERAQARAGGRERHRAGKD